jgi:hypothetical protein
MARTQFDLAPTDINGVGQENLGAGQVNSRHCRMRQPTSD